MDIKFHRLKVGEKSGKAFGNGASWLIGIGILLAAASITIFSYIDTAAIFLIGFIPLIVLFYLSINFPKLNYVILIVSGILAFGLGVVSIPDFFSNNSARSGVGLYHGLLSGYFIGIVVCQVKNSNKQLKRDF